MREDAWGDFIMQVFHKFDALVAMPKGCARQ